MSHVTWRGTNDGEFMGNPPTGATFSFEVLRVDQIVYDKIADSYLIYDPNAIPTQLAAASGQPRPKT